MFLFKNDFIRTIKTVESNIFLKFYQSSNVLCLLKLYKTIYSCSGYKLFLYIDLLEECSLWTGVRQYSQEDYVLKSWHYKIPGIVHKVIPEERSKGNLGEADGCAFILLSILQIFIKHPPKANTYVQCYQPNNSNKMFLTSKIW